MTANWRPRRGVQVTHSDLPDAWLDALDRLVHDLRVRQYGGDVEYIDWVAEYESNSGMVWLYSAVTVVGGSRGRLACGGIGASVDDDVELALLSMADLVQNEVAEAGTAWPWGDDGGFMRAELIDGVAMWKDKNFRVTRIGDLSEKD
jgi:hypothetical protein